MTKVRDLYDEIEFQDLLDEADDNASGSWEQTFVSELRTKFEEYGTGMFISDKQDEILNRIANGG
jgi:hypothetical protein